MGTPVWADLITDELLLGRAPLAEEMKELAEAGVTRVVDVRSEAHPDELAELERRWGRLGIGYSNHPLNPSGGISGQELDAIVNAIHHTAADGGKVYLHCTFGMVRSPACAVAYLVHTGRGFRDALEQVTGMHPRTNITDKDLLSSLTAWASGQRGNER